MRTLRDLIETRNYNWTHKTMSLEDYNLLTNELKEYKLMAAFMKCSYRLRYGNNIWISIDKFKLNQWLKAVRETGIKLQYVSHKGKTYRMIDDGNTKKELR